MTGLQKPRQTRDLPQPPAPCLPQAELDREGLLGASFANVVLCYLLVLTAALLPFALFFALRFADRAGRALQAHYFYVRTTIAILVIGTCVGGLTILAGVALAAPLIFAGLALFGLTLALGLTRCLCGLARALQGRPPRAYQTYLI